ncbi:MAG: acetate--CoA ligase [Candidatus Scalindua sp. AMX11]|nr:MAG: acetate--CoA ligase [Candidatus Scalindua sp.]NOG83859.1 acetate--CoA ligase [Planctomycetota bacterium]RZV83008.1 MAG: acetate--CoA ligase [Candidatus Scalindua sp. SCAELEC01]TDE64512.1 MAG: acetate--CoA ligase [Candidatus Scalindua sp. AMX11]GJQ58748.1 MAG: acetate--CoA ligase [Candidatus Scalindua sp.]
MEYKEIIYKTPVKEGLINHDKTYRDFEWKAVLDHFECFSNNEVNIAHEAIDKHATTNGKNKNALIWEDENGRQKEYTFQSIKRQSDKFANVLKNIGIEKGDRVFLFLPRIPELYIGIIALAKVGAIAGPLFSAFGPEAVKDRLLDCKAKAIITTPDLNQRVCEIKEQLPTLKHTILVDSGNTLEEGEVSYASEMNKASESYKMRWVDPEDYLYILYTSGTTGKPKGVTHAHNDMISQYLTTKWVLDLREDDVYWCTADPGWVTGTVYGIWGPWLNGVSQVVYDGRFDTEKWYSIIEKQKVTVWYTAPTALRMLMKAGVKAARNYDLSSLRYICSVGEPLNPEVIKWGIEVYGLTIHDNWWQTETGSIMIANYPSLPVKPGSMGKPFPGICAKIIDAKGKELPPGQHGLLALKRGWPSMMREIWGNRDKFDEYFRVSDWFATGDTAYVDDDGYFWFVGRADDVINTAGHRVGPFEVESALVEHDAIAEAGVIGKPDTERGEIIKAFVVLGQGHQPSDSLRDDIKGFVKNRLAAHAYPREIEFIESVPKTRSGKIMRRVLKARELGLPTGDLSTLEEE